MARQAKARQLVDAGLSQRQAAKVLGVSQMQVHRDVKQKVSKTDTKRFTRAPAPGTSPPPPQPDPHVPRYTTIVIDPPWPMTKIEKA
ncbi:MAG: hypothetical protein ACREXU_02570 [Gammaproteobacteria bacterium]